MPPRKEAVPSGKMGQAICELIRNGATPMAAARSLGMGPSTIYHWLAIAEDRNGCSKSVSPKQFEACKQFQALYEDSVKARDDARIEAAMDVITQAATTGFKSPKIIKEQIPERTITTRKVLPDGKGTIVTTQHHPAQLSERTEITHETPDWRAGIALLEKLAPDRFGQRVNTKVTLVPKLLPGEAEQIVDTCSPEELEKIERGDEVVLRAVLERLRGGSRP